jgi:serine/threonine-protein kinase
MAYSSNETGRQEIYVRPFPNVDDDKLRISRDGGQEPRWSPDGSELFFLNQSDDGDTEILRVSVTEEATLSAGSPEVLFAGDYSFAGARPNWDISPDGQSFLLLNQVQEGEAASTSLVVVENWFEELNRLAPPSP